MNKKRIRVSRGGWGGGDEPLTGKHRRYTIIVGNWIRFQKFPGHPVADGFFDTWHAQNPLAR